MSMYQPAPADSQRKLLVRHHHLDLAVLLVEHDLADLGRGQRVDHEGGRLRRPGDDVDLLALQLADHGLHAAAAHADAGADRIDRGIIRHDADLGAAAGIAGDGLDLDDAVVDLRHLLREQLGHELRMGARQEDLRAARLAAHVVDVGADAVALAEDLARQQFVAAHDRLGAAEIDHHVAVLDALHHAVDDLADAVLVLLVLPLALGLPHFLHDDLLRRLCGDAAEIHRGQRVGQEVADAGVGVALLRLAQADLRRLVLHRLAHLEQAVQTDLAGLAVDLGADVVLLAVLGARRLLDRVLHRHQDHVPIDHLLPADRIGDLQELEPVGADGCCFHHILTRPVSRLTL
jgi:hypothetical protein